MKDLKITTHINASPADVYAALTNEKTLEIWTGEQAEMKTEPNTEFSWFGGDISGTNIEFEENKRIVQDWDFGDNSPSRVTILVHTDKGGTHLEVRQSGIPDEDLEDMKEGWIGTVFAGLKDLLEE